MKEQDGWNLSDTVSMIFNKGRYIYLAALCLTIQSCLSPSPKQKQELKLLNIAFTDRKTIPVGDQLTNASISSQPFGSENVYFIDPNSNILSVVNAATFEFNVLGILDDFDPNTSRFVIHEAQQKVYIYNSDRIVSYFFDGTAKDTIDPLLKKQNGFTVSINDGNAPIIAGDIVYMHYMPNNDKTYKDPDFFKQPVQVEINTKRKTETLSNSYFPQNYRDHCYGINFSPDRFELAENLQGFSFSYNDSLFIYDTKTKQVVPKYFGTRRKHQFQHLEFKDISKLNETVFFDLYEKSPQYYFAQAAPCSGYITRRFSHVPKGAKKFTTALLIYDKHLNYIGESPFGIKPGIIADSKKGLMSFKLNIEKKCLEISRISW